MRSRPRTLPSATKVCSRCCYRPFGARVKTRTRRRIPYVAQMEGADCAAACLTMVLGHLGRDVTLDEAREAVGAGRGGASAYDIVTAAARFGARGRGVQLDVADLPLLPRGAILHWGF